MKNDMVLIFEIALCALGALAKRVREYKRQSSRSDTVPIESGMNKMRCPQCML
jgi:hypothetical protein